MRFLLALTFCLFSVFLFSQETTAIEYSPSGAFNWSIFKGKVNPHHIAEMGKNTGAVTVSSLSYKSELRGRSARIKISALFLPYKSWTRYPKLEHAEEALNHEKRHFDICEIYARKIRQEISNARFNRYNFNVEVGSIFKKLVTEYRAMQTRYDHETRHSVDKEQQKKWNTYIDSQLASLSDYSHSTVAVTLN